MAESFPVIHVQMSRTAPLEHFVFGERNSGTNFAHALLTANLPALAQSTGDRIGPHGFRFGWKHGFPHMVAAPDTALAIAIFRGPESWLRAMHRRPWHAAPELRGLDFSAFIRRPWRTIVDEQNFGVDKRGRRWGAELQHDRHPLTGERFDNICQLRRAKSQGFLGLKARFANCLMVRHEDLTRDPEGFVRLVSEGYKLPRYQQFRPVEARRGRPGEGAFEPTRYAPLAPEDAAFVWAQLDAGQEARLGYHRVEETKDA